MIKVVTITNLIICKSRPLLDAHPEKLVAEQLQEFPALH